MNTVVRLFAIALVIIAPTSLYAQGYQLHKDGSVYLYTGPSCSGSSCTGWKQLDSGNSVNSITAVGTQFLMELRQGGSIWEFTPFLSCNPCTWSQLDNNPATIQIAGTGSGLYQLHNDGTLWQSTWKPCQGSNCGGWFQIDNNKNNVSITATGIRLLVLRQLGQSSSVWMFWGCSNGTNGATCSSVQVDNNPVRMLAATNSTNIFELRSDGSIWQYNGSPCTGPATAPTCQGWVQLDNDPNTTAIAAGGLFLVQMLSDNTIWAWNMRPCTTTSTGTLCPGWYMIDRGNFPIQIAAGGTKVWQLRNDGSIWQWNGKPCVGTTCKSNWTQLDNNPNAIAIALGNN